MKYKARRCLTAVLVFSLLILMHIAGSGYAAGRSKISFTSTRHDGLGEIYVMDSDGSNQIRLTKNPADDRDPSWSPDGMRITFASDRTGNGNHIYVVDSDGRNLKKLTEDGINRNPAWSPDGRKIAFTRNNQVYLMDTEGENRSQLTQIGSNYQPAWSPNGERIAFVSHRDGGPEIYVMDENGGNKERRTGNLAHKSRPSWSPDGQWIAYSSLDAAKIFQIYLVRADGVPQKEKLTRKPPNKYHPTWSPDGGTIAYTSWDAPFIRQRIDLMTAKGLHLVQFREVGDGSDSEPDWVDPAGWSVPPDANYVTIWGGIKAPTSAAR